MQKSIIALCAILFLAGCGSTSSKRNDTLPSNAKGDKQYGGIFNINQTEYIKTLHPLNIVDVYSYRVSTLIYEGLFKFDPNDLHLVNGLAESYEMDSSHTIYTIKLKKGVYFHDDDCFTEGKGREVTAEDVKYCFNRVCVPDKNNQGFFIFRDILKGANEVYERKTKNNEVEGIKVVDSHTIQFTLTKPSSIFLHNLARPFAFIYPKEAVEKYGDEMRIKTVGTGAFYLANVDEGNTLILKRHPKYYQKDSLGNQLPFLEAIRISFIKEKRAELLEFERGNLDMVVRLPTEDIIRITNESLTDTINKRFILERTPEMTTQYLMFMTQKGLFKDINLRKAFSFAIDREEILNEVLEGEGEGPGQHGVTPPVFKKYQTDRIKGYSLNLDSAQYYLKKAGYTNGKNFPDITLHISPEGSRHENVAQAVQRQLKENLNINIKINNQPFAQLLERSLLGDFDLMRMAYYADYPSPENYLWLFWGKPVPQNATEKSYPNTPRFSNIKYDELYEKGLEAASIEEAYKYFMQAEQVLMNEAVVLVLWYDEIYRIIKPYVRECPNNPMQYWDFSKVYFKDKKKQS